MAKKATKKATKKTPEATNRPEGEGSNTIVPDNDDYAPVTNKVVEVQTPTSRTRFHAPNEKVEFEREKYEDAKKERQAQGFRVVFPNPRHR